MTTASRRLSALLLLFLLLLAVLAAAPRILPAQSRKEAKLQTLVSQAHKALEAKQYSQAIRSFLAARRLAPEAEELRQALSVAHTRRGRVRFDEKKLDLAFKDFASGNRLTPGREGILQSLGVISMQQGRSADARGYMQRVLRLNPKNSAALSVMAQLAVRRDDMRNASKYMGQAASAAPGREDYQRLARKYGKEAAVEAGFWTVVRGRFRLQFQAGKKAGVEKAVDPIASILRQAHAELKNMLQTSPRRMITVVVYTKEQFEQVRWAHAWAKAYYDGKIRISLDSWPAGRSQLRRDLRHELCHTFLAELHPKAPLWLHEGLSQILEGRAVSSATSRFRLGKEKPLRGRLFTHDFARATDLATVHRGYAQALMLVGYLLKKGSKRSFQSLVAQLGLGVDSDRALRQLYRGSLATMVDSAIAGK